MTLPQEPRKMAGSTEPATCGFASVLTGTDTISSGTVSATPSGLTFGTVAVNSVAVTVAGRAQAIGQALSASVTGGTAGTKYTLTWTATTAAGRVYPEIGYLNVE